MLLNYLNTSTLARYYGFIINNYFYICFMHFPNNIILINIYAILITTVFIWLDETVHADCLASDSNVFLSSFFFLSFFMSDTVTKTYFTFKKKKNENYSLKQNKSYCICQVSPCGYNKTSKSIIIQSRLCAY